MSEIGRYIKKYRLEKGITQETLGELLNVTTQAVSRWERGGTPDAEILPELSRILDVSIDALFGREEQSISITIAKKLYRMNNEEAFSHAFGICRAIEIGLLPDSSGIDNFLYSFIENQFVGKDERDYFCKIMQDGGIANIRISPDLHHFFLMVEPQGSLKDQLSDIDSLQKVFETFSDKKMLKIIFYMYSRLNTPIAASLIGKNTGLDVEEVEQCMERLCDNNLVTRTVVATADGDLSSYMFNQESSVIPLLCFADEICKRDYRDIIWDFSRTKPLLG